MSAANNFHFKLKLYYEIDLFSLKNNIFADNSYDKIHIVACLFFLTKTLT